MKQQVKVNWSGHSPGRCHRSPTTARSLPWAVPPADILRPGGQFVSNHRTENVKRRARERADGRHKGSPAPISAGNGIRNQCSVTAQSWDQWRRIMRKSPNRSAVSIPILGWEKALASAWTARAGSNLLQVSRPPGPAVVHSCAPWTLVTCGSLPTTVAPVSHREGIAGIDRKGIPGTHQRLHVCPAPGRGTGGRCLACDKNKDSRPVVTRYNRTACWTQFSTPHWARTSNLRFRRPMLCPIELGVRFVPYSTGHPGADPPGGLAISLAEFRCAASPGKSRSDHPKGVPRRFPRERRSGDDRLAAIGNLKGGCERTALAAISAVRK